jgi:hypothetical protein
MHQRVPHGEPCLPCSETHIFLHEVRQKYDAIRGTGTIRHIANTILQKHGPSNKYVTGVEVLTRYNRLLEDVDNFNNALYSQFPPLSLPPDLQAMLDLLQGRTITSEEHVTAINYIPPTIPENVELTGSDLASIANSHSRRRRKRLKLRCHASHSCITYSASLDGKILE